MLYSIFNYIQQYIRYLYGTFEIINKYLPYVIYYPRCTRVYKKMCGDYIILSIISSSLIFTKNKSQPIFKLFT